MPNYFGNSLATWASTLAAECWAYNNRLQTGIAYMFQSSHMVLKMDCRLALKMATHMCLWMPSSLFLEQTLHMNAGAKRVTSQLKERISPLLLLLGDTQCYMHHTQQCEYMVLFMSLGHSYSPHHLRTHIV